MGVIVILILASLAVATTFLLAFIWAVRAGQFEDTLTPALRPLMDEPPLPAPVPTQAKPDKRSPHER
jgi:cbb3-type cytochrome oxidase maturation protein